MAYRNMETTICRICLEPVTNFICIGCLFDNIKRWVSMNSTRAGELTVLISGKHASIRGMLSQDSNSSFCVSCKNQVDEIACPCCYLYEMHAAIKSVEPAIAQKFEREFNFDLIFHHGMAQLSLWESIHGRLLSSRAFKPIVITDKGRGGTDLNTCDGCEVESDGLAEVEGQWLCDSCRDENMVLY